MRIWCLQLDARPFGVHAFQHCFNDRALKAQKETRSLNFFVVCRVDVVGLDF
jgi:hypothetical protein